MREGFRSRAWKEWNFPKGFHDLCGLWNEWDMNYERREIKREKRELSGKHRYRIARARDQRAREESRGQTGCMVCGAVSFLKTHQRSGSIEIIPF